MKKLFSLSLVFLALSLIVVSFSNCKKPGPTKAVITVTYEDKVPASGAKVLLHAKDVPTGTSVGEISDSTNTDASGTATFEFKNEAVFTIEASLIKTVYDTTTSTYIDTLYFGTGTVRMEPNKTVEETVIIR